MTATFTAAASTHVGLVRPRNEDAHFAGKHLFAVADGLGGHPAGDVASRTVIDAIAAFDQAAVDPVAALGEAVRAANAAVRSAVAADPNRARMGSTLVALLASDGRLALVNVGDSRCYRLRDGTLERLTDDHVYSRLVGGADISAKLGERLTRYVDGRADGRSPDLTVLEVKPGDRFLLCSDGLSSYVPLVEIERTLREVDDMAAAADTLVEVALTHGGHDNVTVVVVDATWSSSTEDAT